MNIVDFQQKKKEKEERELLNKIQAPFMILDIEREDLPFWITFIVSSRIAAEDRLKRNDLISSVEVDFFGELLEDLEHSLGKEDTCNLELSFLDLMLIVDNLELFVDALYTDNEMKYMEIGMKYLEILRPKIYQNKALYENTLIYFLKQIS
jgi:hypothetical protein